MSTAPEAYQKAMDSMLCGMLGVVCYMDDVVIFAENEKKLEQRLRKYFQRFPKKGSDIKQGKMFLWT